MNPCNHGIHALRLRALPAVCRATVRVVLATTLLATVSACTWMPPPAEEPAAGKPEDATTQPGSPAGTTRSLQSVALLDPERAEHEIADQMRKLTRREDLAIAPADSGYYLDILEAELRQTLEGSGTDLFRREQSVLLRIPGMLVFATGSEQLNGRAEPLLAQVAEVAMQYDSTLVIVDSHTDPAGDEATNQELSKQRALTVSRFLITRGIATERIVAFGHGESRPLPGREANDPGRSSRRIEIRLAPIIREQGSETAG